MNVHKVSVHCLLMRFQHVHEIEVGKLHIKEHRRRSIFHYIHFSERKTKVYFSFTTTFDRIIYISIIEYQSFYDEQLLYFH
jgi:hypothetical protein